MSEFRYHKHPQVRDRYTVHHVPSGRILGHIDKYEQRYNLQRLIVVRGWTATPLGASRISHTRGPITYRTRNEASAALAEHMTEGEIELP